jgi:hypothetical protein
MIRLRLHGADRKRRAEITMKSHHATVDAARAEVEPFLRAWELTAALEFRPGQFELACDRATIIDRNPTSGGSLFAVRADFMLAVELVKAQVKRSKYPDPPPASAQMQSDDSLDFARSKAACGIGPVGIESSV